MKKIINTLVAAAAVVAGLSLASCKNPNDNIAQRGITITGVQVRAMDSTNTANTTLSECASAKVFDDAEGSTFLFGGMGLNGWGGWSTDDSFYGIMLNGVIRCIPGSKIASEKYTYYYDDLSFCGVGMTDGAADWDNLKMGPAEGNYEVKNPKDGGTYYVDVVITSDGVATSSLVAGTLSPNIVKVTLVLPSTPENDTVTVNSNISWGGVKTGAWSATAGDFVNTGLTLAVEGKKVSFYVTGDYDITGTWVETNTDTPAGANFKLEVKDGSEKLCGDDTNYKWYKLSLTSTEVTIDTKADAIAF